MPPVARVRAHYAALCAAAVSQFGAGSLAGRLLLIDGLAEEGDALLIAASIAGAASLVLETRTDACATASATASSDFAVTTLDEALRILKNEIRKQQPIAVLLERQPAGVLAEMVERGAQPDMLRWTSTGRRRAAASSKRCEQRGAQSAARPSRNAILGSEQARGVLARGEGSSAALRQLDLLAGQILPQEDLERQNWIARAPRYLPRALRLERRVQMTSRGARGISRGSGRKSSAGRAGGPGRASKPAARYAASAA